MDEVEGASKAKQRQALPPRPGRPDCWTASSSRGDRPVQQRSVLLPSSVNPPSRPQKHPPTTDITPAVGGALRSGAMAVLA